MFLVSEVDLLALFKAGHQKLVQVKTFKSDLDAYACLIQTSE
jgi:hypothetical protein